MSYWVLPTFHPAHILRKNRKLEGLLERDLKRAVGLATGGWKPKWNEQGVGYKLAPSADEVVASLDTMSGKDVAFDIETNGEHPCSTKLDIRCCGFWDGAQGVCVPWLKRDGTTYEIVVVDKKGKKKLKTIANWKPYFSGAALERVNAAVQRLFSKARSLIAQNGQYDRLCLEQKFHFVIPWGLPHFDTILAHHIVASYLPHGLDLLTSVYTDMPYYKKTEEGDAWSTSSDRELWLYCMRDCEATWLSAKKLKLELVERAADGKLYKHDARQEHECEEWKRAGIEVDLEAMLLFCQHYQGVAAKALKAMKEIVQRTLKRKDVQVEPVKKPLQASPESLAALEAIAGESGKAARGGRLKTPAKEGTRQGQRAIAEDLDSGKLKRGTGEPGEPLTPLDALLAKLMAKGDEEEHDDLGRTVELFNPGSLIELRQLLIGIGIPLSAETPTGMLSTKEEFLLTARKELLVLKVKASDDRLAFLDALFAWRASKKVESTYLRPELIPAGYVGVNGTEAQRIHPTFSVHVVPSGRLCIAWWTPIQTKRGVVPLDMVQVGDFVWTHRKRWRRVTAVHQQGAKQTFDVRLSNGYVVTATNDHRLLGVDGTWVTVGELRERLKAMDSSEGQSGSSCSGVSRPRLADARNGRDPFGDDLSKRAGSFTPRDVAAGPAHFGQASLLGLQDRGQESHDGQDDGEAPPMEGALREPEGLPHDSLEGEMSLRPSRRGCQEIGPEVAPPDGGGRSPHRRQQDEQRLGESRSRLEDGASRDSLPAIEGCTDVEVEEINTRGSVETFDLAVEEDESFDAAGIFSHNSSKQPNFQNQPATIRGMFVARPGHVFVYIDWDALEMRLGAFMSGDRTFIEDFKKWDARTGPKVHIVNMCAIFDLKLEKGVEDKYPECYRAAKVFAYSCAYGAGETTVYEQVRAEMPEMEFSTFKKIYAQYKVFRRRLFEFMKDIVRRGTQNQFLDSPIMERRCFFFEKVYGEDSPEASAMQNMPFQSGGSDVVELANFRILDQLVQPWQAKLKKGEVLQQLAQIHDELLFEVPERLAEAFAKKLKAIAEQPPGPTYKSWALPVSLGTSKRWKPIKWKCAHCDKKLKSKVELELVKCDVGTSVWTGKCEVCKKVTKVEVVKRAVEPLKGNEDGPQGEEEGVEVEVKHPPKRRARKAG